MTGGRHQPRLLASTFALLLVACALALRVVIPAGFMVAPAGTASGWSVVLCSGNGPVTVVLDAKGDIRPDTPAPAAPSKHDAPCAFAGLLAPLLPTLDVIASLPALATVLQDARDDAAVRIGQGLAAPPPPVRGPPLIRL